jgi:hypothetical protein
MGRVKWDPAKYARRKPLSTIVDRPVKLIRAPMGSQHWKEGLLHVVDAETEELLAVISPIGFKDPATKWDLRTDC